MQAYTYKVVPSPRRPERKNGARGNEARFARTIERVMNDHAAEGWEFLRSEALPCEERQGLTGRQTVFHTVLVFRRPATAEKLATAKTRRGADAADVPQEPPVTRRHADGTPGKADAPSGESGPADSGAPQDHSATQGEIVNDR